MVSWAKGDWKLVYDLRREKLALYNLKTDIGEHHDVAAQHPKKVLEPARLFTERLQARDVQIPTFKADGRPVKWPLDVVRN